MKYCQWCKAPRKMKQITFAGITKNVPVATCNCYSKYKEEEEKKEEQRRLNRITKQSRLGKKLLSCSFENFIVSKETKEIYDFMKNYADTFDKETSNSILMSSLPGTGKTHLSCAIMNQLLSKNISCVFYVVPDIITDIINKEFNISALMNCSLLILDDLGTEFHRNNEDWSTMQIFQIINRRLNTCKPTIYTTNYNSKELQEKINPKAVSRILECCKTNIFKFDNVPDYRNKIRYMI